MIRIFINLIFIITISFGLSAQVYFPIKQNGKWGLIDKQGNIFVSPRYDAIGNYDEHGLAVIQEGHDFGVINQKGKIILQPNFIDIKVLNANLIGVKSREGWNVRHAKTNKNLLDFPVFQVELFSEKYIKFRYNNYWGLVNMEGAVVADPEYSHFSFLKPDKNFILTHKKSRLGLLDPKGKKLLPTEYAQFRDSRGNLIYFKKNNKWGAITREGKILLKAEWKSYQALGNNFLKLWDHQHQIFLYSIREERIINEESFNNFYLFFDTHILTNRKGLLGLLHLDGKPCLPPQFNEIQPFGEGLFRVRSRQKWGIAAEGGTLVAPAEYEYISPPDHSVCVMQKEEKFGLLNLQFEEVKPAEFDRIILEENVAKTYKNNELTILTFDETGQLEEADKFKKYASIKIGKKANVRTRRIDLRNTNGNDKYKLKNFEWFYHAETEKWGLRSLENGKEVIPPEYDRIIVKKELGFTVVGKEMILYHNFERTTYQFNFVYGLINNEKGRPITFMNIWDIRFSDIEQDSLPVARCVFSDGRHGLITKSGKVIKKDFAYIGDFVEGKARASAKGVLSGSFKKKDRSLGLIKNYLFDLLVTCSLEDITNYDREFEENAHLKCENCSWGYIDTLGQMVVPEGFDFGLDFKQGRAIVEKENKYGLIDSVGHLQLGFDYDKVSHLARASKDIFRVEKQKEQFGLIDSLGKTRVKSLYTKVRNFSENRVAVQRGHLWGFVDENATEKIPCRFKKAMDFKENRAAVNHERKWGFIDPNGNFSIPAKYKAAGNFSEGLAWVKRRGGIVYIDPSDSVRIELPIQEATDFSQGVARVRKENLWGLIDKNGKYILKPKYRKIEPFQSNGLAVVRLDAATPKYSLIDINGKRIGKKSFQKILPFSEGKAVVRSGKFYGYIDESGSLIIPAQYNRARSFSNSRSIVQKEKWAVIDESGNNITDFKYVNIQDFKNGFAIAKLDHKTFCILDHQGQLTLPLTESKILAFDGHRVLMQEKQGHLVFRDLSGRGHAGPYKEAMGFRGGTAPVKVKNKWAVINQQGILLVPPKYDKVYPFEKGFARVKVRRRYGLSNKEGEIIIPPEYEYIQYAGEGLFRVESGGKVGYFDKGGQLVWKMQE